MRFQVGDRFRMIAKQPDLPAVLIGETGQVIRIPTGVTQDQLRHCGYDYRVQLAGGRQFYLSEAIMEPLDDDNEVIE